MQHEGVHSDAISFVSFATLKPIACGGPVADHPAVSISLLQLVPFANTCKVLGFCPKP